MTWWLPENEVAPQSPFKSWVEVIDEGETPPPADPFPTSWIEEIQ